MDRKRKVDRPCGVLKISQKYYNTQLKTLSKIKKYQPYSEIESGLVDLGSDLSKNLSEPLQLLIKTRVKREKISTLQ